MKEYSPMKRKPGPKLMNTGCQPFPLDASHHWPLRKLAPENVVAKLWNQEGHTSLSRTVKAENPNDIPTISPARKSPSSTDSRTIPTVNKRAQQTSYRTNAPAFIAAPPINVPRIRYRHTLSG